MNDADIKLTGKHVPKKLGTVKTLDIETGEFVERRNGAMALLPPAPDVCQVCAVDHSWDSPHNAQSLYYQMRFHAEHGRWPTWTDAMAHCSPDVQATWKNALVKLLQEKGLPVPEDLKGKAHDRTSR